MSGSSAPASGAVISFKALIAALTSDATLSATVKQQISELGEAYRAQDKVSYYLKLKDLVGQERITPIITASHSSGQLELPAALAVVDQPLKRMPGSRGCAVLVVQRRRLPLAPALHNQDWRPSAKADRPKNRRSIRLRIEKLVAPGDCAGERARRKGKLKDLVKWYEKEQWRQAVSDEDYRERLSNNSKELDAEVLKVGKAPRVRKDAMPQLSVSFMVGKLKEFAVASTHKELDRIQNEFTIQASLPAPA
mgnify:CR=1 FL=1